jgi:hypothetical protein
MTIDDDPATGNAGEREWQLQERALQDERLGRPVADASARLLRYRMLSRQLQQPLDVALPADFARIGAHRIEQEAALQKRLATRFRRRLLGAFALVYGSGTAAALLVYGHDWLPPFASVIAAHPQPFHWLLALLGCAAVSRLLDIRRHAARRPG